MAVKPKIKLTVEEANNVVALLNHLFSKCVNNISLEQASHFINAANGINGTILKQLKKLNDSKDSGDKKSKKTESKKES